MLNPFGEFLKRFREAHQAADTDAERASIHHTLGAGPTQAAPGNHNHYDVTPLGAVIMWFFDTLPDGYLECLGQTINDSDYPDFFRERGIVTSTYTLPNIQDRYVKGHTTAGSAVGTLGGNALHKVTLTSTQLPGHTHSMQAHTHTGPSHSHDLGSHTHTGPSHTHDMTHTHNIQTRESGPGPQTNRVCSAGGTGATNDSPGNTAPLTSGTTTTGSGGTGATGAAVGNTGAAGTGNTGGPSATNTGSAGTGSAFNIEPRNIIGMMIMRVR